MAQVQNLKKCFNESCVVEIYNSQELANDTKFVHDIVLHSDLIVLGFDEDIVKILSALLNRTDLPSIGLFYDTTFKLGDSYLSLVSFTEHEFDPPPTIPAFYMIHERKTQEMHEFFWRKAAEKYIPQLATANRRCSDPSE